MADLETHGADVNCGNLLKQESISKDFDSSTKQLFKVIKLLLLDLMVPTNWSVGKVFNGIVTAIMLCLACYSLGFTTHMTFSGDHTPMIMSSKLLLIGWAVQAIVSLVFLIYWQLCGCLQSFHRHVLECQNGKGLCNGENRLRRNVSCFYLVIFVEVIILILFNISYYLGNPQSDFVIQQANMFYFPELRILNTFIALYTYIAWNVTMFIYITYIDATFLEVKHFNDKVRTLDGATVGIEAILLKKMDEYGKICDLVRELDHIFRLYAFIMLAIIIPSVIFTLMMLNERIHGFKDLIICLPSIGLSAYSFFAVTVAPARLHEEVSKSRICLIRNATIWFPYRKNVFLIAQALSSHMDQHELGISVWGFATLSRPLILATFSVMAMVLSLIIELTPPAPQVVELINATTGIEFSEHRK